MANFRGMVATATIAAFLAFGSMGCDDDDRLGGGGPGGTSTTTTSITTTTVSTTSTTTTTVPVANGFTCAVEISVTSGETLGSLQWNTDYSTAQPGGFEGAAASVSCTSPLSSAGAIVTFNDDEPAQTLRTGIISLSGFTGPTVVAACTYIKDNQTEPVAGDFGITLVDAADPSFNPQTPTLAITDIACTPGGGSGPTTTSTTTTSTTTTSTTLGGGGGSNFNVLIGVVDALNFGALQYNVDYSAAPGGFEGAADSVSCTSPLSSAGAIVTFNDDEGASTLRTGIISLGGFAGPTDLATCVFTSTGAAPVAGDFTVTVVDASDPGLNPIAPLPTISITSITGG